MSMLGVFALCVQGVYTWCVCTLCACTALMVHGVLRTLCMCIHDASVYMVCIHYVFAAYIVCTLCVSPYT